MSIPVFLISVCCYIHRGQLCICNVVFSAQYGLFVLDSLVCETCPGNGRVFSVGVGMGVEDGESKGLSVRPQTPSGRFRSVGWNWG